MSQLHFNLLSSIVADPNICYNLGAAPVLSSLLSCPAFSVLSSVHGRFSSKHWNLDDTSFFVVVDASIQRFKEMLEVNFFIIFHAET